MNETGITGRLRTGLLVIIVLLAGVIAIELYLPGSIDTTAPGNDAVNDNELSIASAKRFVAPDISSFDEVLRRPLFFQDRILPPEPTPEPITTAPLLPLRLALEGIAITSESRVAVLRNLSNNQLLQLTEGASHDGWLLESVSATAATFKRGGQVTELVLDPNGRNGRR